METFTESRDKGLYLHDKCSCGCGRTTFAINARKPKTRSQRIDPTRTTLIRRAFEAEMVKRFRKLMDLLDLVLVELDVLGLEPDIQHVELKTNTLLPRRAYAFARSDEKVAGFMNWFHTQVNEGILGQTAGDPRRAVGNVAWSKTYIDSAYKRGLTRAESELRAAGISPSTIHPGERLPIDAMFGRPIHADRVGLIYTRTYTELKGVTDSMEATMSTTLAQGISDGKGPRTIAREMKNRIEKAGGSLAMTTARGTPLRALDRARMIARTETIRAHNVANINVYREAGLMGVTVQSEWLATIDDRVCPRCLELNGKVFALAVIESMIPLHPNCRCAAIPYLGDPAKQGLKQIEDGIWGASASVAKKVALEKVIKPPPLPKKVIADPKKVLPLPEIAEKTIFDLDTKWRQERFALLEQRNKAMGRYDIANSKANKLMEKFTDNVSGSIDYRKMRVDPEYVKLQAKKTALMEKADTIMRAANEAREKGLKVIQESVFADGRAQLTIEFDAVIPESQRAAVKKGQEWVERFLGSEYQKKLGDIPAVRVVRSLKNRSSYDWVNGKGVLQLSKNADVTTVIHELGHHIEGIGYKREGLDVASRNVAWFGKKTQGYGTVSSQKYNKKHYLWETTREDNFPLYYWGQNGVAYYHANGVVYTEQVTTEIMSMGMQTMYEDPTVFLRNHPDAFKHIYESRRMWQ